MRAIIAVLAIALPLGLAAPADGQKTPLPPTKIAEAKAKLKLPESLTQEELEFLGSSSHRSHAMGRRNGPNSHFGEPARKRSREASRVGNRNHYGRFMDQAWTIMLYKKGFIPRESAVKVLAALEKTRVGGEEVLKRILKDRELASIPVIGRTLQEPMSRMQLRDKQLDVIEASQQCLEDILNRAETEAATIMPGATHMAHAQPTTYGAYLVAIHDGLYRSLEQLELAYKHTNENSGGCGACSGTGWDIDRNMITELLGFDRLVEPCYDCEAGQDYATTTLFALSSAMLVFSRTAIDHSVWGMDGYNVLTVPSHLGVSSLMPQKAHPGSAFERVRMSANSVLASTVKGIFGCKNEFYADVLPIYDAYKAAIGALCEVEMNATVFSDLMKDVVLDRQRLLELTRDGWGCTSDLQEKLIREKGYGRRPAWQICAVMVRIARAHRKIKPCDLTGEMLDEAALVANQTPPGLSTAEIQEIFDPVKFLQRHNNVGDPNPKETLRLIELRRKQLAESRQRQAERRACMEAGFAKLRGEIAAILGDAAKKDDEPKKAN